MKIRLLNGCFGLMIFVNSVIGQDISQWHVQHIDKKAGLSNSAITSIYMDHQDNVWFGSWDGLIRYDGSTITTYKPDPLVKGTISNNVVRDILEDKNHELWIVTHSGINRYNQNNDSFVSYFDNIDLPFQEYNLKACLGPDSSILVGINGWGIGEFSDKLKKFKALKLDNTENDWLKTVIGIGAYNGYVYILGHNGKIICLHNQNIVYSLTIDPKGFLQQNKFFVLNNTCFLAIPSENNGLNLYNLSNGKANPIQLNFGNSRVSSISLNLQKDALWVGTESGNIYTIYKEKDKFKIDAKDTYFPQLSQRKLKILSITETKQNILWIGTDGDGIYKFSAKRTTF